MISFPANRTISRSLICEIVDTMNSVMNSFVISSEVSPNFVVGRWNRIMNIMLVTVTERTKKWSAKSIGRENRGYSTSIFGRIFCIESIGGIFGIIFGYVLAYAVAADCGKCRITDDARNQSFDYPRNLSVLDPDRTVFRNLSGESSRKTGTGDCVTNGMMTVKNMVGRKMALLTGLKSSGGLQPKKMLRNLALVLCLFAVIGCSAVSQKVGIGSTATQAGLEGIPVTRGDISAAVTLVGNVTYAQSAVILWKTTGVVQNVNVKIGDQVKQDDILAELSEDSLNSSVLIAEKNLMMLRTT